jgi:hypothetical protein
MSLEGTVPTPLATGEDAIQLKETIAFSIVIGASLFSILWGLVNALLVRFFTFDDKTNLIPFRSEKLI